MECTNAPAINVQLWRKKAEPVAEIVTEKMTTKRSAETKVQRKADDAVAEN